MQNGRRAGAPGGTRSRGTACRNLQGRAGTGTGREPPVRHRILELETALAHRQSAAKSAQTQAASEVADLNKKVKELQFRLRQMWDWYNDKITKAGGLTFKASSLIAKALHPDATPSEQVRLEAFKAFSAWKSDRDAAKRG